MAKKEIYLDYAAATPIDPRVKRIFDANLKKFGNPSSLHKSGQEAKKAIENARATTAKILNCRPEEIVFTGSATEANSLAILGVARARGKGHLITTAIEHPSVLSPFRQLEKEGFALTFLPVGKDGIIKTEDIKKAIRPDTILISVIYASNEIGTIQPISEIANLIRNLTPKNYNLKPFLHTDACQAAGVLSLDINKLGVDLLTLSGAKIYSPKGVGCLYVKRNTEIEPLMFGGSQERGLRPGTENTPAIIAFAEALKIVDNKKTAEPKRLIKLRDYLIVEIQKIPGAEINGDLKNRLPNNINISFKNIDAEILILKLSEKSIYVSAGSACTAHETGPSHVLKAIGQKNGGLRITLGRQTTAQDIKKFLVELLKLLPDLRN